MYHTIGGKRIVSIVRTVTPERELVCFEKDSLAVNCPNRRTIMTPGHEVYYKNKLIQAKHFVGRAKGVHNVKYTGEMLYNVLMDTHNIMRVNNMLIETLHPDNKVAKKILSGKA